MDFHHLHVVNYERKSVENENKSKNDKVYISEKCQSNEKIYKGKPHKNKAPSPNIQPIIQQSKKMRKEQAKLTENSSRTKERDAVQRILPSVRTLSLDDLGKKLKKCNSFNIKQNFKNRLRCKRLKINNMMYKERKESQDDIKVLYTSQRFGEQSIKNEVEFKIDPSAATCNKKPSKNDFKTQIMSCRWKNRRLSKTDKNRNNGELKSISDVLPAKRLLETCHHAKRDEICYAKTDSFQSREFKVSNNDKESLRSAFIEETTMIKGLCTTVPDALTDKEPLKPLFLSECSNKTGTATSTIIIPLTVKVDKKCGPGRKVTVSKAKRESNAIVALFLNNILTILNYFLLALTAIAWSPCLIVAFLLWYVVSPMTPSDVRADEFVPACLICRNSFFSKLVECVTRSYMKTVCAFEVVRKLISTLRCHATCASKVIEQIPFDSQPNTDKKYIVYHSEQRGWLMKPMRGQHKRKLPNRISSVYPVLKGERSRNIKSVSFRDSVATDRYNQSAILQTSVSQHENNPLSPDNEECRKSCVCQHENKPPDIKKNPKVLTLKATQSKVSKSHVGSQRSNTSKVSETETSKSHPITETPKATRRSVGTSFHRSHHSLKVKQPPPRKIFIACPHHKPVPRRPKTFQSDPEIGREGRSQSRYSLPNHYHEDQQTHYKIRPRSQQRCKRQFDEKHHKHHNKRQYQNSKVKLAAGDRTRNEERTCKQIYSISINKDKLKKNKLNSICNNPFLLTLNKKPCFWVYALCPNMYPYCLTTRKMLENCCTGMLYICSACIWCPIIICLYFCYYLICDCMSGC